MAADHYRSGFDEEACFGMMLIFPDHLKSMPVLAAEIMPRIRERVSEIAHAA